MTKYAILGIQRNGEMGTIFYIRNTLDEDIAILNREEEDDKKRLDYVYDYYKFIVKLSDNINTYEDLRNLSGAKISTLRIIYTLPQLSFMKRWTVKEAQEWIRKEYSKSLPPVKHRKSILYTQLLKANKNAKYEVVAVSYDGKFGIVANGNTPDEAKKNWEKLDVYGLDKYVDYPYVLVIPAHKGNKESILKQRVIDADALDADIDFGFMKGWTVERAIKKIVAENKKEEKENPDEPLLWGLDSGL